MLFGSSAEGAVVAADSRQTGSLDSEYACKLIALGDNTLFFSIGRMEAENPTGQSIMSSNRSARDAFRAAKPPNNRKEIQELANRWGGLFMRDAAIVGQASTEDLTQGLEPPGSLGKGVFISATNDGIVVYSVWVTVQARSLSGNEWQINYKTSEEESSILPTIAIFGLKVAQAGVGEFYANETPRAKQAYLGFVVSASEKAGLEANGMMMASAITFANDISPAQDKHKFGGAVDIAILSRGGGIRWVQRQQKCHQEDTPGTQH